LQKLSLSRKQQRKSHIHRKIKFGFKKVKSQSSKMADAPDELNLKRAINNINREICEDFITF
jgi:hypothetical protein